MKLELRNVSCGYDINAPLVKNASMELSDGDVCCILGPNGVGKTTLFKTILNLVRPLDGKIFLDGADTIDWTPRRLSQYMAYVAQAHTPAFPYLVREAAMMGRLGKIKALAQPSKKDYEIVESCLEEVGIRHLRDARCTEISGGEMQLVLIARALCAQPKLLIMDEPTANLDYGNMVLVMRRIRLLADSGLCVIFTTHMPDQAFLCEAKTALLRRKQPVVFGDAGDVITEKNLYDTYRTSIQILEVISPDGVPVKAVVPRLREN